MRTTRTLVFRDDEGDPVLTVSTELQPNPERAALYIETSTSDLAIALTGENVEELHEWTRYVLEGRQSQAAMEAPCGEVAPDDKGVFLVCGLRYGHEPVGEWEHVTRDGVLFNAVPF